MSLFDKYKVKSIPKNQTTEWLLKKHYAHRIPSIVYSFGLYDGIHLVGVCTYGIPTKCKELLNGLRSSSCCLRSSSCCPS